MKASMMLAALMLAGCGPSTESSQTGSDAPQSLAVVGRQANDDRPLADRMVEANASDFETADLDATSDNMTAADVPTTGDTAEDVTSGGMTDRDAPAASPTASVKPPERYGSCSDGKRVCGDMNDCADAVFHLEQCGMTRLDRDHDGTPCEKICG